MGYEYHSYTDAELKIIFHSDTIWETSRGVELHWHKNPEILWMLEGQMSAIVDGEERSFSAGDLVVIGSNAMHSYHPLGGGCRYHCLIVDYALCAEPVRLPARSNDPAVTAIYRHVVDELANREPHYREAVEGLCRVLMARLAREGCATGRPSSKSPKVRLVRHAMQYIYEHFEDPITLESLCSALGVSKCYLSHVFKEITGQTMLQHLQYVRCTNARSLLVSGECNVAQAAFRSGFNTFSYFSKTYLRLMGCCPGDEKVKK